MTKPFAPDSDYELHLVSSHGRALMHVWKATNGVARRRGLLGSHSLERGHALWLSEPVVHMIGMTFALDLVFLNRRHQIIKICRNVKPGARLRGSLRARSVLEMTAGEADRLGLACGLELPLDQA